MFRKVSMVLFVLGVLALYLLVGVNTEDLERKEFALNLVEIAEHENVILLEKLVPMEWDRVHVFKAYATSKNKYEYVGYKYSDNVFDIVHENTISMIFFKDDRVVYNVDNLRPGTFDFTRAFFDNKEWGYQPEFEDALYDEKPGFVLEKRKDGYWRLTLTKCMEQP